MANVDVILRSKIDNLGAEADVVKVRRGFARNFLIPQGKAYEATKSNLRHLEALKAARAAREAEELNEAEAVAAKLKKLKLKLELAVGAQGKAFGSITTMDIVKAIKEKNDSLEIDRHQIELDKPIKNTGRFDIPVKLHPEVTASIRLQVATPEPEEKAEGAEASEEESEES